MAIENITFEVKTAVATFVKVWQRTLTIWGSITVQLTSCLTGLDSTKQVKLMLIKHKQSS